MSAPTEDMNIDEVLTIIGFGSIQWRLLFSCGFLMMLTVNETMGMSILAPASQCDFNTTPDQRANLKSAAFLGIICASYFWGYLCDIVGRWRVLVYSTIATCSISILSMFMTTYYTFLISRFLVGLTVAGPGFITLPYMAEFCTNKNRPQVINYMSLANGFAAIYCPTLATYILQEDWYTPLVGNLTYSPWRYLGVLFTLPGLIGLALLMRLPESPIFLLSVSKNEEAYAAMEWICLMNTRKRLSDFGITQIKVLVSRKPPNENNVLYKMMKDMYPLMHKPYFNRFLLSCCVIFGLFLIANGMGLWFTDMRNRANMYDELCNGDEYATVCTTMTEYLKNDIEIDAFICNDRFKSFRGSIYLGATFIIIYNLLGLLLFKFSRRIVFIVPLVICSICGFTIVWVQNPNLIVMFFVLFLALPGVVFNLLGSAVMEFVPTYLRGKAMCFCMMFGRLGAVIGASIIAHSINDHVSCIITFNIFALVALACAALGLYLPM